MNPMEGFIFDVLYATYNMETRHMELLYIYIFIISYTIEW